MSSCVPLQNVEALYTIEVLCRPLPLKPLSPFSVPIPPIQADVELSHHVFQLCITNHMSNGDVRNDFP